MVEEFSLRDGIRTWANGEKQKVRMEAMQHWQAKKAAAVWSCGAVTTTATTVKEALDMMEEEPDEFPDITSARRKGSNQCCGD